MLVKCHVGQSNHIYVNLYENDQGNYEKMNIVQINLECKI